MSLAVSGDIDVGNEWSIRAQDFNHDFVVSFGSRVDIVESLVEIAERHQRDDVGCVVLVGFVKLFRNIAGTDQSSPRPRKSSVIIGIGDPVDDRI